MWRLFYQADLQDMRKQHGEHSVQAHIPLAESEKKPQQ